MSVTTSPTATFTKEKEEISFTQQTTNSNSTESVKSGSFPCFICSTTGEEEVALVATITSHLSAQIAATANQAHPKAATPLNNYTLHFLSPDQVELEIQIQDFLSDLGAQENSQSSSKEHPQAASPFSLFASPRRLSKESSLPYTHPSSLSKTQGHAKIANKQAHTTTQTSTTTSTKHSAPAHEHEATSNLQDSQNKFQELLSKTQFSLNHSEFERARETLLTIKTLEQRNTKQDKDHQQQSQQDAHQDDDHQQSNKKTLSKTQSSKEKKQSFSIADLQYLAYSQAQKTPARSTQTEKSAVFQKKAPSPIDMFTQTNSKNSFETSILESSSENIFVRFMNLMARILGQAEAEAHELYLRVKARTDDVDTLTLLLSKINNESDAIDWEEQEDLKKLIDRAKELGVPIHDSYQWSIEEKKLLKENIIMRKENLEKITQLERTDMQRLLQEVSQCHQTRSNVLKLLKELMDTFIYNLRP